MGNIDLTALEIFKAVADQGGITKAAARLHRVQSNVTTRVNQLEERLGTKLFLRRNGRLDLSPEGQLLLGYAERLLHLSSEAEAALRNGAPHGTLRIGALESVAAIRLPPVLAAYHRAYPDVRVELATGTTGALIARVLAHEVEAAFVAEPFTADGLDVLPVWTEELVLITPRPCRRFRTPRDVGHTTLIAFANGCSYRRRLEAWLGAARVVPERVMEFSSYHAILACVAAGAGIAIVPRSVIGLSRAGRDLRTHRLPPAVADARTALVCRQGHRSAALQALGRLLIERGARTGGSRRSRARERDSRG
jgi:DNA-binding transcriptional LysR family regulator